MKIYAARVRSDDTESILDQLIGKDIWVEVYDKGYNQDYFMRILSKHTEDEVPEEEQYLFSDLSMYYIVNRLPVLYVQPGYFSSFNISLCVKHEEWVPAKHLKAYMPLNTYSTDELFSLEGGNGNPCVGKRGFIKI